MKKELFDNDTSIFLHKPIVKTIILGLLSFISTISGIFYDKHFIILLLLILSLLIYLLVSIHYASNENNLQKSNSELESQNKIFNDVMEDFLTLFKNDSNYLHNYAKYYQGILEYKDLNKYSFQAVADTMCKNIYCYIKKIAEKGEDFSVSYIKAEKYKDTRILSVRMIAYANPGSTQPYIYNKSRTVNDPKQYFDIRQFIDQNPDGYILPTKEKVSEHFSFKKGTNKKYCQYISIPVFCDANKMDGLLQVIALNDSIIKESEEELLYLSRKILRTYSYLFLFLSKLDKVLKLKTASIRIEEKNDCKK